MDEKFVITATAENVMRVLQRMSSLVTCNRLKMEQIYVIEMNLDGCAHLTLVLRNDEETVEKFMKQLRKMSDLLDVKLTNHKRIGDVICQK